MKQADAQAWCRARGITPSEKQIQSVTARLEWARQAQMNPTIIKRLTERLKTLGIALGWADEAVAEPQKQPEAPDAGEPG
jgi:hypothetical protein